MVWFDRDVLRLNYDGRGELLGEFQSNDQILVILKNGDFYTTSFELSNHYESSILIIEKYEPEKVWTAVVYDADQKFPYIKRFSLESSSRKQNFVGENPKSELLLLTDERYPRLELVFGGTDAHRPAQIIDAEAFATLRSFKAKGKRLTTYKLETVNELEPAERTPEELEETVPDEQPAAETPDDTPTDAEPEVNSSDLIDEITGQMKLF